MNKRWKRIGIAAFVLVAVALTLLIVGNRREPQFADSIAFLKGKTSIHREETMNMPVYGASMGSRAWTAKDFTWSTDTYTLDEPFESLNAKAKQELKPRANSASAWPTKAPTTQLFGFNDPKRSQSVTLTIVKQSPTRCQVSIVEFHESTWLERAKGWVHNLFRPEPKQDNWIIK